MAAPAPKPQKLSDVVNVVTKLVDTYAGDIPFDHWIGNYEAVVAEYKAASNFDNCYVLSLRGVLSGSARDVYDSVPVSKRDTKTVTAALQEAFPVADTSMLMATFRTKQADHETVDAYIIRFMNAEARLAEAGVNMPAVLQIDQFVEGLVPAVRAFVKFSEPSDVAAAYAAARRAERSAVTSTTSVVTNRVNVLTSSNAPRGPQGCFDYHLRGSCNRSQCKFRHGRLCRRFHETGQCNYGKECKFAHIAPQRNNRGSDRYNRGSDRNNRSGDRSNRNRRGHRRRGHGNAVNALSVLSPAQLAALSPSQLQALAGT
jgi:Zinc finger C-x8-C-x5-C-x3-H type (and similar)